MSQWTSQWSTTGSTYHLCFIPQLVANEETEKDWQTYVCHYRHVWAPVSIRSRRSDSHAATKSTLFQFQKTDIPLMRMKKVTLRVLVMIFVMDGWHMGVPENCPHGSIGLERWPVNATRDDSLPFQAIIYIRVLDNASLQGLGDLQ